MKKGQGQSSAHARNRADRRDACPLTVRLDQGPGSLRFGNCLANRVPKSCGFANRTTKDDSFVQDQADCAFVAEG